MMALMTTIARQRSLALLIDWIDQDWVPVLVLISLALAYVWIREWIARAVWRAGFRKHTPRIKYVRQHERKG